MSATVRTARDLWLRGRAVVNEAVNEAARRYAPVAVEALNRYLPPPQQTLAHHQNQPVGVPTERIGELCSTLALRDLNLINSVLDELQEMYRNESNPDLLGKLYRIDNLANLLRRNSENMLVLAGKGANDTGVAEASLVDLLRAAASPIRQYERIAFGRIVSAGIVAPATADIVRVLAELLDNAANNSPPTTQVRASAHFTESGSVLVRIEDDGLGMSEDQLYSVNRRLSRTPEFEPDAVAHMGLSVVARLAARHHLRVRLDRRTPTGTTSLITIPAALVCDLPADDMWSGTHTVPSASAPNRGHDRDAFTPITPSAPAGPNWPGVDEPESPITSIGLPRRVPASLRPAGSKRSVPAEAVPSDPQDVRDGHDRMLSDLAAFDDGIESARSEQPEQEGHDT
ncbi:MAG TPA: ATP-binding protein [Pseudonocardiaceae bacterium]|nr:ATP-binding protein [Pseudonocardiaceae bacterium]